jgi:hypothetical protein
VEGFGYNAITCSAAQASLREGLPAPRAKNIPVLRFHFEWGDNEIKMAKDMQETFARSLTLRKKLSQATLRPRETYPTESMQADGSFTSLERHAWEMTPRPRF